MEKRANTYKIQVEELKLKDGGKPGKSLTIEIKNHDDLFHIIEMENRKISSLMINKPPSLLWV